MKESGISRKGPREKKDSVLRIYVSFYVRSNSLPRSFLNAREFLLFLSPHYERQRTGTTIFSSESARVC